MTDEKVKPKFGDPYDFDNYDECDDDSNDGINEPTTEQRAERQSRIDVLNKVRHAYTLLCDARDDSWAIKNCDSADAIVEAAKTLDKHIIIIAEALNLH